MSNFFVLGLPRSRTAWLANFLSYGDHFCFHEGINGCYSIKEYIKKLGDKYNEPRAKMLSKLNVQVINPYDIDNDAAKALFDECGISDIVI